MVVGKTRALGERHLSQGKSDFLHLIRWVSAVFVVLGHTLMVDRYIFGPRDVDSLYRYIATNHHAAVIVFFILSGYLISLVSKRYIDDRSLSNPVKSYLVDRWSRIYSVLIPGILLTLVIDQVILFVFPSIHGNPLVFPQKFFEIRLLANVFLLQGTWGHKIQFGSNSALWSIGYEFSFYLVFGLYLFYGKRFYKSFAFWCICCIFFLIRGPLVMWYMLMWLMGVLSQKLGERCYKKLPSSWLVVLLLMILLCNHFFIRKNVLALPYYLNDFLFAIPVAVLLFFDFKAFLPCVLRRLNAVLANFSYTLYVTHLPVLFLAYCLLSSESSLTFSPVLISMVMTIICVIFGYFFSKISESRRIEFKGFAGKVLNLFPGQY